MGSAARLFDTRSYLRRDSNLSIMRSETETLPLSYPAEWAYPSCALIFFEEMVSLSSFTVVLISLILMPLCWPYYNVCILLKLFCLNNALPFSTTKSCTKRLSLWCLRESQVNRQWRQRQMAALSLCRFGARLPCLAAEMNDSIYLFPRLMSLAIS